MDLLHHYESDDEDNDKDDSKDVVMSKKTLRLVSGRIEFVNDIESLQTVRSQPHVTGNWSGHVRISLGDCASCHDFDDIDNEEDENVWYQYYELFDFCIDQYAKILSDLGYSGKCWKHTPTRTSSSSLPRKYDKSQLHVSLSRPFYLQLANIDSFISQLGKRLELIPTFDLLQQQSRSPSLQILNNDENTRSFLVMPIRSTNCYNNEDLLESIVQCVNEVLKAYRQPSYPKPALFHISLASWVPAIPPAMAQSASILWQQQQQSTKAPSFVIPVTKVQCHFGTTKIFDIPLMTTTIQR
jgi:hypothetical protein